MTRKNFADWLRLIADNIESGDCLGGSISFNAFYGVEEDKIEALGCYRVGNLGGQGGVESVESFEPNGILKNFTGITAKNRDVLAFSMLPRI